MKHGNGLLPALISDTGYANTFKEALTNVKRVSTNANALAQNLESLTSKMNDKDNAVGVLLADTAIASSLKQTIKNAELASEKLDENMAALQHNFLLRGYFRKQEKRRAKEEKEAEELAKEPASSRGY
jgi:phospholipid/cholesterol/gamma-HCH transport system substrate-binding protein